MREANVQGTCDRFEERYEGKESSEGTESLRETEIKTDTSDKYQRRTGHSIAVTLVTQTRLTN